jgi:hypothetical protein
MWRYLGQAVFSVPKTVVFDATVCANVRPTGWPCQIPGPKLLRYWHVLGHPSKAVIGALRSISYIGLSRHLRRDPHQGLVWHETTFAAHRMNRRDADKAAFCLCGYC